MIPATARDMTPDMLRDIKMDFRKGTIRDLARSAVQGIPKAMRKAFVLQTAVSMKLPKATGRDWTTGKRKAETNRGIRPSGLCMTGRTFWKNALPISGGFQKTTEPGLLKRISAPVRFSEFPVLSLIRILMEALFTGI